MSRHDGLEGLEVDPQIVRVEVSMFADVLERVLVLVGALRRLPQDELAPSRREMPSFLVVGRPFAAFHHERGLALGEI
jgi:hypothetical protein